MRRSLVTVAAEGDAIIRGCDIDVTVNRVLCPARSEALPIEQLPVRPNTWDVPEKEPPGESS
jgi:hypothetical protein